jgi:SUKH-4 immunity protein
VDRQTIEHAAARLPARFEPLLLTFHASPRWLDDRWAVLGSDEGTELRVDADTGQVLSVDPTGALPSRFVNSTIDQFIGAIDAYRDYVDAVQRTMDESVITAVVERLRQALVQIDATAVADGDAWWAVVLEQVEQGLL